MSFSRRKTKNFYRTRKINKDYCFKKINCNYESLYKYFCKKLKEFIKYYKIYETPVIYDNLIEYIIEDNQKTKRIHLYNYNDLLAISFFDFIEFWYNNKLKNYSFSEVLTIWKLTTGFTEDDITIESCTELPYSFKNKWNGEKWEWYRNNRFTHCY
jgi:hypothetical protein